MSGTIQIDLGGEINSWTAGDIIQQLRARPDADVLIRIHSPGGSVLDGWALANALQSHAGKKTAVVMGACASAATFVLCACKPVQMFPESMIMLHAPLQEYVTGNAEALEAEADVLRKMEDLCVGMYRRRTGADEATVRKWMQRDTWMSPTEAKQLGLCDEILTTGAPPAARARAARYVAMARKHKDKIKMATENDGIPDGGAIPEHLMAKLAKCGMGDDADKDGMMSAYMTYMSTTDDGPAERQEMRKAMERMKMAEMGDDEPEAKMDDMDDEESSADKSKKMAAKLRQSANLDPAVAKLVDTLTGQVSTMGKKLSTFEAKEKARAEESFYAAAEKYTSREDAADYVSKCGGDTDKAMALIKKLPQRSVFGRLFAGGSPVSGTSAKDAPVENTKTLRTGRGQTTTLHGITLAALAKKRGGKTFAELAAAQVAVARERPDLYQPR